MKGALVILAVLIVIGVIIWAFDRKGRLQVQQRQEATDNSDKSETFGPSESDNASESADGECCGRHAVCEKTSLSPLTDEAIYYDDHELDRFRGREPETYSDNETEEFRDILMSLLPDDVAGWSRSLQVRGISLPVDVRDEVLMIVGELRNK
ncbi:MAG: phospholipase [Muribaculaceae bacterium]|nr:phospholipase [Muribaculaceae bacterium]